MKTIFKILCLSVLWFSCEEQNQNIYGCTLEAACNFNPNATTFDDSCIYLEDKLLEGYCSCDEEIVDCSGECGGNTQEEDCITEIKGHIYNSLGEPLENTAIFLTYEIVPIDRPSTNISISITESSPISVWITDFCGNLVSNLLDNEWLDAGIYNIVWDATDDDGNQVLNGSYTIHMNLNGQEYSSNMFLYSMDYTDIESIEGYNYHALTNDEGYFSIPIECLSFGVTQTMTLSLIHI